MNFLLEMVKEYFVMSIALLDNVWKLLMEYELPKDVFRICLFFLQLLTQFISMMQYEWELILIEKSV